MKKNNTDETPLILKSLQAIKHEADKGTICKKPMLTGIATKIATIGDLFIYHKRKYICLGAKSNEN